MADLLAIRLFRDDPGSTLAGFFSLMGANLRYLGRVLPPFLVICLPLVLALVQLEARFGARPLRPGQTALVGVQLPGGEGVDLDALSIAAGPGLAVETAGLRIPALGEVDWRIRAVAKGRHLLTFRAGDQEFTKEVVVGEGLLPLSPRRVSGFLAGVLHPREEGLPATVTAVHFAYPAREFDLFGLAMHWLVAFFLLSLLFAFLLRRPLGVEI